MIPTVIAIEVASQVPMNTNPYEPSTYAGPLSNSNSLPTWRFSFWSVGPITGACVGMAHATAVAFAWALHGYPDFHFRSGESAFIYAGAMSIGGAIFGVPYAGTVAVCSRALARNVRPQLHFWIATIASFALTYVAAEMSLRRRELISPLLVLATIIAISFSAALTTAKRTAVTGTEPR